MKRVWKWTKRILLGLVSFIAFVVLVVLIVLHTDWGRKKALEIALPLVQKKFYGKVEIERLSGSVLGDISVHGLTIHGPDGKRMIHVKKATTNLEFTSLFGKAIELKFIEVEGVEVNDPGNPMKPPPDDEPFFMDVRLPQIRVRDAKIALSGEQPIEGSNGPHTMTFETLSVDASFEMPVGGVISASTFVTGYWKEHALPFKVTASAKVGDKPEITFLTAALGDLRVVGSGIVIDTERPVGALTIHVTPAVLNKFAPKVALPRAGDVTLVIADTGTETRVDLFATMGDASVRAGFFGSIKDRKARGLIAANGIDIGTFVPRLQGAGSGVVGVVIDPKTVNATAIVRGQLLDLPAGHAFVNIAATENQARALLVAGGNGGLGTAGIGTVRFEGKKVDIVDAQVISTVRNASAVSNGKVPFKGAITVGGSVRGSIAPKLALELDGDVYAYGLISTDPKMGGIGIAQLTGHADGTITEAGTFTHLKATAKNVSRGGSLLGTFEVDARNRRDGKIAIGLHAKPAAIPGSIGDIAAVVDLGRTDADPIHIELGDHSVKAQRVAWTGTGGTITITEQRVLVSGISSKSGSSSLTVDATIEKATQALEVKANLKDVPLASIDKTYSGTVSASVDMRRRGMMWNGKANVTANGMKLGPEAPTIEGKALLTIANQRVTADVTADAFQLGGVRLVLDVDGPKDITDPIAWRRLERKAVRTLLLGVTRIDLAAAKIPTGGTVEGELVLTGMDTSGKFAIRGVQTKVGTVDGDINFSPIGDELGLSSSIRVANFGEAQIAGQIALPKHPFEPTEWKQLGRGVVKVLTVNAKDIVIDPKKLEALGIDSPMSARVSVHASVAAGDSKVNARVDIRDVKGGPLLYPVDVLVEGEITAANTTASVNVRATKPAEWSADDKRLLAVKTTLPTFPFDRWVAEAGKVIEAPLEGTLEIPNIDLVETLAMIGRKDIKNGKVGGTIKFAGTVGKPTANGELVISNVDLKPRLAGRKLPTLTELRIRPSWDGTLATLQLVGKESDGATLDIKAQVEPARLLETLNAKVVLKKFDIAPIAVFLPGPLVAATGMLTTDITVAGITPDKIHGSLQLEKGRVPVAAEVGTVRDANVDVRLTDKGLTYNLSAKLGSGTIKLKGHAGADLRKIHFEGSVDKVSPIHEIAPVISATFDGDIFREAGLLRAEARLTKTNVNLNMDQGVKLLDADMPEDLFLGRSTPPPPTPKQSRLPRKPWITVNAIVDSTPVYVKHEFFEVRARVRSPRGITLKIGRTFGMDGSIEIERGDVDVLGRHYRVDPGPDKIRFDGSADPLLAIRLTHDFPELTLTADIVNRASKREIVMNGTPAIYTQDELFAFFIGGDPAGGSGSTTRDVASNAGAAFLSAKLQKTAKKVIPFKVDVVACDAGTSASGASCKLGRWLTENWFVAFKQRIEPRQDESPQEFQVQYYFRKNWVFEGAGAAERVGADILWRKRW